MSGGAGSVCVHVRVRQGEVKGSRASLIQRPSTW